MIVKPLLLFLLLAGSAFGADEKPIRLPISKEPVVPTAVTELTPDAIFVVESDVPCLVLASRQGFVSVTQEAGPLRMRGRFSDGKGISTRTYTAPHLFIVEAVATGEVELLIVPTGAKDAAAVVRRTLIVSGEGPRPPPKPVDPDEPKPPVPVTSFRVIFVRESGATLNAAQTAIPQAKAIRDYLFAKTTREGNATGWREYDPQVNVENEQQTMRALWEAVKPKLTTTPCIVIEVNGKAEILQYPASTAEALALLKKYGG